MLDGKEIVGLVAVVLIFGTPLFAMIASVLKSKHRTQNSTLSEKDSEAIEQLKITANKMHERIGTLELILDNEIPGWREDHE